MRTLTHDLQYGVRLLGRAPGFASAAVLTIALGIGATTAMFSIVYGVLLRPLPFSDPDRLVTLWTAAPKRGLPRAFVAAANVRDWRARNHVFEDIALVRNVANFNLVGQGEPERLQGARVWSNLFPLLRVSPLLGRTFTEEEDEIGHDKVVLLGYGLWQRRFGGDRAIVGRTIMLNGEPHVVVGVMRREFAYPDRGFEVWTPLVIDPKDYETRQNYSYISVARLVPGATLEQARAELSVIAAQLEQQYPAMNTDIGVDVAPMLADTVAAVRTPLYVLLAAVGAMLLIGCANLANLLVARALGRQRELALRAALGASRRRLIAQSLAELVPLVVAGGALGLLVAAGALDAVIPLLPADVPRVENIALHWKVLLFTAGALTIVAMLVGLWPALESSRCGLAGSVTEFARGATGTPRSARARDILVVAQIATTLLLVVGATLLMRSFAELRQVDPGFSAERVYSAHLAIPRTKYPKDLDVAEYCARIMQRVQALPDVASVGMVNRLPLAGGTQTGPIEFEGVDPSIGSIPSADLRTVTPDYFRTLQIPLAAGRAFTDADGAGAPLVGIIDERLAKTVFPNADPIGHRVRVPLPGVPWMAIVGVVGHIRHDRLDADSRPQLYWNYRQRAQDRMALVVRARADPDALAHSISAVIRSIDPEQPIYDARTLEAVVERSLARRWMQTVLLGAFASIALLLASIGVYGVIAHGVGQRQREFGIRMALGADRLDIVAMVLRRGAALFVAGAVIGLVAAAALVRVLATLLFNVRTLDVVSFAAATLVLFAVGAVACYLPARRAARVDPTFALRAE